MHIKRFLEWIHLKEKLHSVAQRVPHVSEGQIWWASLGENIGFEINGKSADFTRPVVILKKFTHSFYLIIPLSTQIRTGNWYVSFIQKNRGMVACLHQIRSMDYRRLHSRLGELNDRNFKRIKDGFHRLYPS